MLVYFGSRQALEATQQYEQLFTHNAGRELSDMFIFIDPKKLYTINIIILIVVFLLSWALTGMWVLGLILGVVVGSAPRFVWKFLKTRRNNRFIEELPDALLSLSSMMRAGTNLNTAMETLVSESRGPIAQEFGLFLRELKMGLEQNQALTNIAVRMPLPEVELFVAAMKISREVGGSLAEILARLSETLRRKLEMEGKIKALTAQGKAQGWVMTLLPIFLALILFKIEPVAMGMLFSKPIGWAVCAVFFIFLYIGYFFIKKIVSIDV